jgi:hypothetical protein
LSKRGTSSAGCSTPPTTTWPTPCAASHSGNPPRHVSLSTFTLTRSRCVCVCVCVCRVVFCLQAPVCVHQPKTAR